MSQSVGATRWVTGFVFRNGEREVALVSKTHPAWQAGKLNGVGGKIEVNETAEEAMQREFEEEAGAVVSEWREYALLKVQDGEVVFLVAHEDVKLRSMTDEIVDWYPVADIQRLPILENLKWLIPLALDTGNSHAEINYFQA